MIWIKKVWEFINQDCDFEGTTDVPLWFYVTVIVPLVYVAPVAFVVWLLYSWLSK